MHSTKFKPKHSHFDFLFAAILISFDYYVFPEKIGSVVKLSITEDCTMPQSLVAKKQFKKSHCIL